MTPKKPDPDPMTEPGDYPDRTSTVSATECTGLFPALPVDDPEAEENMARLYAVHAPITKEEEARIRCEEGAKGRRSRP